MSICFQKPVDLISHQKELDKLVRLWSGQRIPEIEGDGKERHVGDIINKAYGGSDPLSKKLFHELVLEKTGNIVDQSFTMKPGDYKRIANAIVEEGKQLRDKGRTNFLERHFFVKRGVMHKTSASRYFNKGLNSIENYERNKFSQYVGSNIAISKYFRAEFIKRGLQSRLKPGTSALKYLDMIEKKAIIALSSGDAKGIAEANKYLSEIDQWLKTDESGKVIQEFIDYMEHPEWDRNFKSEAEEPWSQNIKEAGKEARKLLNRVSTVYIRGLERFGSSMAMSALPSLKNHLVTREFDKGKGVKETRFDTSSDAFLSETGKIVTGRLNKVAEAIDAIKEGVKGKAYFPHYSIKNFFDLEKLSESLYKQNDIDGDLKKMEPVIEDIITSFSSPASVKPRSSAEYAETVWMKNPIAALRRYTLDGIAFNRNNHLKELYMETTKHLPDEGTWGEAEILNGMRRYLDDVFKTAYISYKDRPEWMNKTTRVITGMEFLSKMGFGATTALRNGMSGLFFIAAMGANQFRSYRTEWDRNDTLSSHIRNVEQDQGFKFKELSSPAFTEGLLPTRGLNESDVKFITNEDGTDPRFEYKEGGAWKIFDAGFSKVAGKAAVFQRWTENYIRREMFRATFVQTYQHLKSRSSEMEEPEMLRISKEVALESVNKYAFEYAAFAKPPVLGGTHKKYGAVGQVLGQFFHFPFSFLQLQSRMMRDAKEAAAAGQWDSEHTRIPLRFFGLWAMTNFASGFLNLDLTNIIEHDTMERVKDFYNKVYLGKEGLARSYVGPAMGDAIFLASLSGILKMPDSKLLDLIVGANDAYKMTDEQKSHRLLSTVNVQAAKLVYRDWPSLDGGTGFDALMHETGLYPRSWTRKLREHPPLSWIFTKKKPKRVLVPLGSDSTGRGAQRKSSPSKGIGIKPTKSKSIASHVPRRQKPKRYNEFDMQNLSMALSNLEETAKKEGDIYTAANTRTHHIDTT